MKKHISIILILALVISVFSGLGNTAKADGSVALSLSPGSASAIAGDTVSLTATVTNSGAEEVSAFQIVCSNGSVSTVSGGAIASGASATANISFAVSDSMIGTALAFTVQYKSASYPDFTNGGSANFSIAGKTAGMSATFAVAPSELAAEGDTVTFKFVINNTGEVKLTDINVKIPGINKGAALNTAPFVLNVGESKTFDSYQHKVTAAAALTPVIEYKVNGAGAVQTYTGIAPVNITIENRKVEMTVETSTKTPAAGETVTYSLTIANKGNVPYTNVKIYLDGEKVDFKSNKLDVGATYSSSYERSYTASKDVKFLFTAEDHTKEIVKVEKTVSIVVAVDEGTLKSKLTMEVEAKTPEITSGSTVTFQGHILNSSEYDLKDLVVTETTQNISIPLPSTELASSQPLSFTYDMDVSETTTFNFQLTATDASGVTHTIDPVPVVITVSSPIESAPATTDEVGVSASPSSTTIGTGTDSRDGFGAVVIIAIVLVVLIIGVGVALLVLWRLQKKGGAKGAGSGSGTGAGKTLPKTKPATAAKKRPVFGGSKRKGPSYRGYRDRNNF